MDSISDRLVHIMAKIVLDYLHKSTELSPQPQTYGMSLPLR